MPTNGVNSVDEADMTDCSGEKVVTMMDVLQQQQEFEEDADAVLGASDHRDCTYSKGYIKRQAIYACLTCCNEAKEDASKRAGVCLACSLNCHENHDLIELYTKRNFRCDCGNPKFGSHPCQFVPDKTELNVENRYNQNFSGIYCICHRPYPDPDLTTDDEMIQCVICEDWLHSSHLESTVPSHDQYSEMICKPCLDKNDFLHDYADIAVTVENENVDVVNDSSINNTVSLNDTSICDNSVVTDNNTTLNDTTPKITNDDENSENVNNEGKSDDTSEDTNNEAGSDILETNTQNNESTENTNNETTEEARPAKDDNLEETPSETNEVSESTSTDANNAMAETTEQVDNKTTDIISADNGMEVDSDQKEIDAIDKFLAGDDETSDIKDKSTENGTSDMQADGPEADNNSQEIKDESTENVANDITTNEPETAEKGETQSTKKETPSEINSPKQLLGSEIDLTPVASETNSTVTDTSANAESSVVPNAEICVTADTEATSPNVSNIGNDKSADESIATKISAEINDNSMITEPIINNDIKMNEDGDGDSEKQESKDNKRKLSIENSAETSICKKPRKSINCIRPTSKKVLNGASFWPSNFRQKLCTCNECISMYKDLSVLFLTDLEDTVSAYETLGKEKSNGAGANQYEQGLEALSSLDRVQQINALTEYNKMRDKLLDFLKSFKDRKEVVKEDDIKQFFAGMKAKREPDGVYFCR